MKRINALLLAGVLALSLTACGKQPISEQSSQQSAQEIHTDDSAKQSDSSAQSGNTATPSEEAVQSVELVGPWHLDAKRNDLAAIADAIDLFPGYGEWGAGMEITSDGQMSWYIGAESWHGTYTVEDGTIKAQLTSELDQIEQLWEFQITTEETTVLQMDYPDLTIYWVYGEQADPAAADGSD